MSNSLWVSTGVQLMTPEKERPHKTYAAPYTMRNYNQVSSLAIILFQKKDRDKLPWQKSGKSYLLFCIGKSYLLSCIGKSYLLSCIAERFKKINFLQLQNVS